MLHVALEVQLGLLAVGRGGQGDEAEDTGEFRAEEFLVVAEDVEGARARRPRRDLFRQRVLAILARPWQRHWRAAFMPPLDRGEIICSRDHFVLRPLFALP